MRRERPPVTITTFTPLELLFLVRDDRLELRVRHAIHSDDVFVDQPHIAARDGSHRELGVPGKAKLAYEEHVERSAKGTRDLVRHRHASSR